MVENFDKKIVVNKAIADKNHIYFTVNIEAFEEAIRKLHSVSAIKLFLYLAKNQDKYSCILQEEEFSKWANEDVIGFKKGFEELIENKFLIKVSDNEGKEYNLYNFYDYNFERTDLKIIEKIKPNYNNNFIINYYYNTHNKP